MGRLKMLTVEMTEQTRGELLRDIKNIQSDIWYFKKRSIVKLEDCIDDIDCRLENFINDLEMELMEYQE